MRGRLRLFAVVGLIATSIDVGLLLLLSSSQSLLLADGVALALAAMASYLLNRLLTFRGQANARWVRSPAIFGALAVVAGLVDLAILLLLHALGLRLVVAKGLAVAGAAAVRWIGYRWVLFNTVRREMAERQPRSSRRTLRLSVVIPAYNEERSIGRTIDAIAQHVERVVPPADYEIIVVDDGSSDRTADVARSAGATVVQQRTNRGKGSAVRTGFIEAGGRSVIFTDADLAYPPQTILDVLAALEDGWDFVAGSRRHEETTTLVRARRVRELGGRVVNWLTHLVLLGHFRDTQCGIKGFQGDLGRVVFERTVIDGFSFDVELFLIAEQDQLSMQEIPVTVENRDGSSVRVLWDTAQLLKDLVRIRRRAGAGGYRPTHHQELVLSGLTTDGLTTDGLTTDGLTTDGGEGASITKAPMRGDVTREQD